VSTAACFATSSNPIKTPPFCQAASIEAGYLLRLLQKVFSKKTRTTPKTVIDACTRRLREYDRA
jgi:hypothetical protein